jgi:PTH1 family peptidyl-tRNA hydrolase
MLGRARHGRRAEWLVVGLGNPGSTYEGTRHNVGADVVRRLVDRHGGTLRSERGTYALTSEVALGAHPVVMAVPTTFMNDSGVAVAALVRRFGPLDCGAILVVHDELDLPVGVVRVKVGGGTAGHNGLRSIEAHLHSSAFLRVRIGISKPASGSSGASYVLARPRGAEREELAVACERAADAVEAVVAEGPERAMTSVNARRDDAAGPPGRSR